MQNRLRKILVVDDEEKVRTVLSEGLRAGGFGVETASGGREAVEQALKSRPDLILLDLLMPEFDGWQTVDRLRQHDQTRRIPIVMLTAKTDTREIMRSSQEKLVDYLIKPVEIGELVRFLDSFVEPG